MIKMSFGYPTSGMVTNRFTDSLSRMMIYESTKTWENRSLGSFLGSRDGCFVNRNRAFLVQDFLDHTEDQYIVMVDPDIEFGIDLLEAFSGEIDKFFIKEEIMPHIIGGRVNILPGLPVFFSLNDQGYARPNVEKFSGLKEFYAVGFGMICLSRVVLTHLLDDNNGDYSFFNPMNDNGINTTDDFAFCKRASELGYLIHGSWEIYGHHWKSQLVVSDYQE